MVVFIEKLITRGFVYGMAITNTVQNAGFNDKIQYKICYTKKLHNNNALQ